MTNQYALKDFQQLQNLALSVAAMAILEIYGALVLKSAASFYHNSSSARDQKSFDVEEVSREIMDS